MEVEGEGVGGLGRREGIDRAIYVDSDFHGEIFVQILSSVKRVADRNLHSVYALCDALRL